MTDLLIRRLTEPPFGTETSERNLMAEAARALLDARAELARLRADAQAAVALMVERAAERLDANRAHLNFAALLGLLRDEALPEPVVTTLSDWLDGIAAAIRALAPADGLAAVEALRVEARENAMQALASMGQAQEAYEAQLEAEAELARVKADAQAAQAMVVERAVAQCTEHDDISHNDFGDGWRMCASSIASAIRALAPADGFALVQELRAETERLERWRSEEGEKIKRQAKALTDLTKHCQRIEAENAGLARKIGKVQRGDGDHSQIADLEAKVINQRNELANLMARDGRLAELAADRYRLAAANAALEAKVAGLVEALAGLLCAITDTDQIGDRKLTITGGTEALRWLLDAEDAARAALATQEAGNAQSTPPISPEEAQFNAVRHHERFGPLDEKGNPVDPRRRG